MRHQLFLAIVLSAAACSSSAGFDRGALRSQVSDPTVVTEDDIRKALDARPQLPSPFRLAVHFAPPAAAGWRVPTWEWRLEEKRLLLDALAGLRASGAVSDAFAIDPGTVEGGDNRAVRLAAARAGADAVLVVRGVGAVDEHRNALAVTYVLILPALFVPGTVNDVLFLTSASLWDVRNQYLYLSSEAEAVASQTRAPVFLDASAALAEARADALRALAAEVSSRLASMK